jgi:signal transduction histidine kinase
MVALWVSLELRQWIENIPFVLFFVVVSAVSAIGGAGPGVLAVASSAWGGWWLQSTSAEPSNRAGALIGATVFVPAGVVIAVMGALVRAGYREREDAARELSAAVRARDEFISIASHELRTPLTSLTLSVQKLTRPRSAPRDLDDPSAARTLTLIARQAARLNVLVNNLLDVSRITSGRLHLELATLDLAEVVRDVASRFEDEVARTGAKLTLAISGPVVGRWDRVRLEQVVANLLSNAIKYGQGKPIEVAVSGGGGNGVLAVSDQGIGIDPADQARIFDRFERLAPADGLGGLGLGLWIVRGIVTALAGAIVVDSAPGRGTRLVVTLPLAGPAGPLRDVG